MANISEELGGRSTPISQPQQESKGTGNDLALDQHFETGSPGAEKADPKKIDGHDAQEAEAARQVRGIKWALIIGSVLTSTFLFGLDNTITANIQPTIVTNFNSVAKLPWLSVAFMACAGSTTLFWGAMYGQCNIKWLYITCITVFEVGSALCGAAPTMNALIVGRAICGFGGTGMYTGVLTLLSALTAEHERATYFGLIGLVWGTGTVLGPIIGGAFTSSAATWRWSFYINLVVAAVCAPVYLFLIPSIIFRPKASLKERLAEVDIIGAVLIVGSYLSILMAISFGGVLYPWKSGSIIALFVVSGVLAIISFCQQYFSIATAPNSRGFPLHFFRSRSLSAIFILECCSSTLTYVPIFFIPLYFQFAQHSSAIHSGVQMLPLVCLLVTAIVTNGFVMTATGGRYMPWFLGGGALGLIGSALLYTTDIHTSNAKLYGFSVIIGTGAGCYIQLPFSVVQGLVDAESMPKAIGFVTFAQLGSASIVLSVVNAIFLNEASRNILRAVPSIPYGTVLTILSGAGSQQFSALQAAVQETILEYIVAGLNKGYIVTMTAGALTIILSLSLDRGKLFG